MQAYVEQGVDGILIVGQLGQSGRGTVWNEDFYPGTTNPPTFTQAQLSLDAFEIGVRLFVADNASSFATGIYHPDRFNHVEFLVPLINLICQIPQAGSLAAADERGLSTSHSPNFP